MFSRTQLLLGKAAMDKLAKAHVAVFGIGGVGGYVVEVLARSGIGALTLIDKDVVDVTNLNRQIIALHSTVGQPKVEVARQRVLDINPDCRVTTFEMFYLPENADSFDFSQYDYVVDCVDTVTAKLDLIRRCHEQQVPLLSCMGAANKMDATAFRVADIYKTNMDPLAKIIRKKLRKLGIPQQKVVYSEEEPMTPAEVSTETKPTGRPVPASNAFVPAAAGLVAGGEVVKDLINGFSSIFRDTDG
jgi:tRNA A37 threonylcarbamoyladenosine dehydratase